MWEGRDAAAFINKAMIGCMAGCWLSEWMDEWMDVREMKSLEVWRDFRRWMNTEQLALFLHFLSSFPLLSFSLSPFLLLPHSVICPIFSTLSLSFSVSLILTRWVIAVAPQLDWLMHSKSAGRWNTTNRWVREGAKEWEERLEREEWRIVKKKCVCVCVHLSMW